MTKLRMRQAVSFKELVIRIVKDIPKGKTLSYGEVALRAGSANAARAVGMIMAKNTDMSVPCHRVIRRDGNIGGYNGIRGGKKGSRAKTMILRKEKALIA